MRPWTCPILVSFRRMKWWKVCRSRHMVLFRIARGRRSWTDLFANFLDDTVDDEHDPYVRDTVRRACETDSTRESPRPSFAAKCVAGRCSCATDGRVTYSGSFERNSRSCVIESCSCRVHQRGATRAPTPELPKVSRSAFARGRFWCS